MNNLRKYLGLMLDSMQLYIDKAIEKVNTSINKVKDNTPSDIDFNTTNRKLQLTSQNGEKLGEGVTLPSSDWSGNIDLSEYATFDDLPKKVSQLTNDLNYVTENYMTSKGYATTDDLGDKVDKIVGKGLSSNDYSDDDKNKVTNLYNNKIKKTIVEDGKLYLVKEDGTKLDEGTELPKSISSTGETVDLTDYAKKKDIPTKTSQLTNDSNFLTSIPSNYVTDEELNQKGYLTSHQDLSGYAQSILVNSSGGDIGCHGQSGIELNALSSTVTAVQAVWGNGSNGIYEAGENNQIRVSNIEGNVEFGIYTAGKKLLITGCKFTANKVNETSPNGQVGIDNIAQKTFIGDCTFLNNVDPNKPVFNYSIANYGTGTVIGANYYESTDKVLSAQPYSIVSFEQVN